MPKPEIIFNQAVELLKQLIATPSFSREEDKTAGLLYHFFTEHGIGAHLEKNNVWASNKFFSPDKPTLLLNSHHDTVRPNPGYTRDPFTPVVEDGKLYGLGSNDAGGPLVSLIGAFLHFYNMENVPVNLVMAATAEEEISGKNGIEGLWPSLPKIDFAIVGEPTSLEVASSEKGLLVLDCLAQGKDGHAAREEGDNAIYKALKDIEWFRTFSFPRVSSTLGKVKMSVTIIQAGQAHNQIPSACSFTVDIRVTDAYTLEEILETVKANISSQVTPRSLRLKPSGIPPDHMLVKTAGKLGKKVYGSPTTSDRALIQVPSIKMGPGESGRSHSANEFIFLDEIRSGISTYIQFIDSLGAK